MYLIKSLFPVFLLKQIHYRHRKQGEEEDDYSAEGDDYPFHYFHDGGERGIGSLHVALHKVQSAWRQNNQVINLADDGNVGDYVNVAYAIQQAEHHEHPGSGGLWELLIVVHHLIVSL